MRKATVLVVGLFWLAAAGMAAADKTAERPNFVIIFTDDQGYGDLGCIGGEVRTPRIDRMAAEGQRLTSFYVAAPLCTPSRAALMIGCYPKRLGLDDNTLVFFTSDNGPVGNGKGSAGPLRGSKGNTYEGGMRVPAVVRWPGHIPSGRVNDELMTAMDLLPTFARLAGGQLPTDRVIDGKDIWPVLTEGAKSPHGAFFYHKETALECVRQGPWKLRVAEAKPVALYNLDKDIGERKNVLSVHPEIVERLLVSIRAFSNDIAEHSRPAGYVENPKPLAK